MVDFRLLPKRRSSLFRDVRQRRLVVTEVSGPPIGTEPGLDADPSPPSNAVVKKE